MWYSCAQATLTILQGTPYKIQKLRPILVSLTFRLTAFGNQFPPAIAERLQKIVLNCGESVVLTTSTDEMQKAVTNFLNARQNLELLKQIWSA